jgi:hypothetical protein
MPRRNVCAKAGHRSLADGLLCKLSPSLCYEVRRSQFHWHRFNRCNLRLYGWLESSVNMIEGLKQLFAPGATTVVFSPFLLLFIILCLGVFIGVSLLAVVIAAVSGGLLLRSQAQPVSPSFSRSFVLAAVICQFVLIFFAIEQNAWFLLGRPRLHPTVPVYIMASLAAANAALNLFVAALIIRKLTAQTKPPPA